MIQTVIREERRWRRRRRRRRRRWQEGPKEVRWPTHGQGRQTTKQVIKLDREVGRLAQGRYQIRGALFSIPRGKCKGETQKKKKKTKFSHEHV